MCICEYVYLYLYKFVCPWVCIHIDILVSFPLTNPVSYFYSRLPFSLIFSLTEGPQ